MQKLLGDFLRFMQKNHATFFVQEYEEEEPVGSKLHVVSMYFNVLSLGVYPSTQYNIHTYYIHTHYIYIGQTDDKFRIPGEKDALSRHQHRTRIHASIHNWLDTAPVPVLCVLSIPQEEPQTA